MNPRMATLPNPSSEQAVAKVGRKKRPVRVLRVVFNMGMGGIETTAMHLLRKMDRSAFSTDFLYVCPEDESFFDKEIKDLGAKILHCSKRPYWSFSRRFENSLRKCGPYDVVHSHLALFNGMVLRSASQAGVPVRIAHSHSDYSIKCCQRSGLLIRLNRQLMDRYATLKLAISSRAAVSYYGKQWQHDPRVNVLVQGRDLSPFDNSVEKLSVRKELRLPEGAFVLGNVGRFVDSKNHVFLLEVAAGVIRQDSNSVLLLVGDGPLRSELEARAKTLGISDRVFFTGSRQDVPRLLLGAVNVFVFPSAYEGLGMVLLEAQAAGLPCVYSDMMPVEVDVVKPLLHRLSLSISPAIWAETVLDMRHKRFPSRSEALEEIKKSGFNIEHQVKKLEELYLNNQSVNLENRTR